MTKIKTKQIILLILGVIIILLTYFYNPEKKIEDTSKINEQAKSVPDTLNTFENITYNGFDKDGNAYEINAKFAETKQNDPDTTFMKTVVAYFFYKDGRIVTITSDAAIYNKITNDMFFQINVKMVESENVLLADNIDVISSENFIKAYNNIKFSNGENLLFADQMYIDLSKKTSNISMNDDEKVIIKLVR